VGKRPSGGVSAAKLRAENAALREENWALKIAALKVQNTALKLIIHKMLPQVARAKYLHGILVEGSLIPKPGAEE
jgi:hypothetical protein